jgi:hypothetical protein
MIRKLSRILAVATLVLTGMIAVASAQEPATKKVKIDFDFFAGKQLMPAGEYIIKLKSNTTSHKFILVQQVDGSAQATVATVPNQNRRELEQGSITFNKYGSEYYLSGVALGDERVIHSVPKTRAEREVSKKIAANKANGKSEKVMTQSSGQ